MGHYYAPSISSMSTLSSCTLSTVVTNDKMPLWSNNNKKTLASNSSIACLVTLMLFTDMLLYGTVISCLPTLIIDQFHGTPRDIGILFSCFAIGYLIATPLFVMASDKFQTWRYPTLIGSLFLIVSTLCFAWGSNYMTLVIARICQGISAGASWTIGLGILADIFPIQQLGRVMGTVTMLHTIGFVSGPVLGGVLYDCYEGTWAPFYMCAFFGVLTCIGIVCSAEPSIIIKKNIQQQTTTTASENIKKEYNKRYDVLIANEEEGLLSSPSSLGSSSSSSIRVTATATATANNGNSTMSMFQLLRSRRIISLIVCCFITSATLSGFEPALPIYLKGKYHVSISTVGVIFVALAMPSFLSPLIGYLSDQYGRVQFIGVGMFSMTVAWVLMGVPVSEIYYMTPPLLLLGLSNSCVSIPLIPELNAIVTELGSSSFANAYALYNMSYSFGSLVGPIGAGLIMSITKLEEPSEAFQILVLIFSGVTLTCFPFVLYESSKRRVFQ